VWQDATALWEANVRSSPGSFRGHNQLGAAYHGEAAKIGATPEALPWIEKAIASLTRSSELYPDWYHAHLNLGIVYRDRGRIRESDEDFETSILHFRKCRELAENEWGARLQIATTYGLWKKYDEALTRFEAMAEEDREPGEPRKTIYLFPMAKLNMERGELETSERLYREIVRVDASDLSGYEGLATVLGKAGRRAEGVAVFEELVAKRPGDALVHVAYARFLDGLDPPDKRGASAQFQRALGLGYPPSPAEFDRFLGN
jgi:tetratricopeptide (TPR) repeat protein